MTKHSGSKSYLKKKVLSLSTTRISKVFHGLSPETINKVFQFLDEVPHKSRQRSQFYILLYIQLLMIQKVLVLGLKIWEQKNTG